MKILTVNTANTLYNNCNLEVIDRTNFQVRLDTILLLLDKFNDIMDQIEFNDDENPDMHNNGHETFKNSYFVIIAKYKNLLKDSALDAKLTSNVTESSATSFQVKLPTLVLPKFNGQYNA